MDWQGGAPQQPAVAQGASGTTWQPAAPFTKAGGPPPGTGVPPPGNGETGHGVTRATEAEPNPWASMRRGRPARPDSAGNEAPPADREPQADDPEVDPSLSSRTVRMTNFPASWVVPSNEGQLVVKIRNLLEKFGGLENVPVVQRFSTGPPVATATFEEATAASVAIQTLHGVDNRNQAEKKKAGHAAPQEWEKFYVQLAPDAVGNGDMEASPVSAVGEEEDEVPPARGQPPDDALKRVRIGEVPSEWSLHDIQELCTQYGAVTSCTPEAQGTFIAVFSTQENAASATQNLHGFQVQTEAGQSTLTCVHLGVTPVAAPTAPPRVAAAPPPQPAAAPSPQPAAAPSPQPVVVPSPQPVVVPPKQRSAAPPPQPAIASVPAPEPPVTQATQAAAKPEVEVPLLIYVDELIRSVGDPSQQDREIFLRDLPLEDYSEQQLREWLDSFGRVDAVEFLKEPASDTLTGKGYVRFPTHEEANGLIAAFPVDDEEGNVQGTWSLSERLRRGADGPLGANVVPTISEGLSSLKGDIGCAALYLVGDGSEPVEPSRDSASLKTGPLRFAAWPCSLFEDKAREDQLRSRLTALLNASLPAPPPATTSRTKTSVEEPSVADRAKDQMEDDAPDSSEEDAADDAQSDHEEALPEEVPSSPCIRVTGFPASWSEQQVKLVFALFGGVATVRFIKTSGAGGRVAHVELKNPENMDKAVEQLHNTSVGDGELIEECTVMCELVGPILQKAKAPIRQTLFIDDLPMPKRPDLPPGEKDREVFLQNLPVKDCTEDQIKSWLEGFGAVEDVHLLREPYNSEPTGRGYVRFATHREARACVEAQASAIDAEEGDVVASWSESERAAQRVHSVYGADLHTAFAGSSGRVLAAIVVASKQKELWMLSEQHQPKDKGAPKPEARQLHFSVFCSDTQFQELRDIITGALQGFHEKVSRRLRDSGHGVKRLAPEASPDAKQAPGAPPPFPGGPPPPGAWRGGPMPPPGEPWQQGFPPPAGPPGQWFDWHGRPPPPGPRDEWLGRPPAAASRNPYARPPPPGWYPPDAPFGGPRGFPERPGQYPPGYHADGWLGPPPSQDGSAPRGPAWGYPPGPGAPPFPAPAGGSGSANAQPERGPEQGPPAVEDNKPPEMPVVDDGEAPLDPKMLAQIEHGEKLVTDGKRAEKKGLTEKAYEKYCRGLQYLLDVMPKLGESGAKAQELRKRINGYLDEAEKLKQKLDTAEATTTAQQTAQQAASQAVEATVSSKSAGAPPSSRPPPPVRVAVKSGGAPPPAPPPPTNMSKAGPPDHSASPGGRKRGAEERQPSRDDPDDKTFLDSAISGRVKRGEALIREGKQSEELGKLDEAYERYCRGLQHLLEVMPKLTHDNPQVVDLRKKIGGYLEQAERLKEKLENPPATGPGMPGSAPHKVKEVPRAPSPGGGGHKDGRAHAHPDAGGAARGNSRHRRRHSGRTAPLEAEPPHFEAPHRDGGRRAAMGTDRPIGGRSRSPARLRTRRAVELPQHPHDRRGRGGEPSRSRSHGRRGRDGRRGLPTPGGATLRPGPHASLRESRGGDIRGSRESSWNGGVPATRAKAAGPGDTSYPFVASKAAPSRR